MSAICIRKVGNWTKVSPHHKLDSRDFSPEKVREELPVVSPKIDAMIKLIRRLDEKDLQRHGRRFKHIIYSDVKPLMHGAKAVASALLAHGYQAAYDRAHRMLTEDQLGSSSGYTFALLISNNIYGKPIATGLKRDIISTFNARPQNIHGELVRFLVLDNGYKEGLDVFDVKYIHILEPQITPGGEKQVIGRGTRFCGQKGLDFIPRAGWPLHVFRYDIDLKGKGFQLDTVSSLFLQQMKIDTRRLTLAAEWEKMGMLIAVDAPLTQEIHNFRLEERLEEQDQVAGLRALFRVPRKQPALTSPDLDTSDLGIPVYDIFDNSVKPSPSLSPTLPEVKSPRGTEYYTASSHLDAMFGVRGDVNSAALRRVFSRHKGVARRRARSLGGGDGDHDRVTQGAESPVEMDGKGGSPKGQDRVNGKDKGKGKGKGKTLNNITEIYKRNRLIPASKLPFLDLRDFVEKRYRQFIWPKILVENKCRMDKKEDRAKEKEREKIKENAKEREKTDVETDKDKETFIGRRARRPHDRDSTEAVNVLEEELSEIKSIKDHLSLIGGGDASEIISLTPSQRFIKTFFQPSSPYKGILLWHGVGVGKSCTAIATASSGFESAGYSIIWVTRHTLKTEIWKNMFQQVCHDGIAHSMKNDGLKVPSTTSERVRLLSQSWITPLSYKQFSNLLLKRNRFYQTMVERNGSTDPLRKTLLIIDEAHKLYNNELVTAERPNVKVLEKMIQDSYRISGKESVRVMLMTATPYGENPMDLIALLNLLRESDDQFPSALDMFQKEFLGEGGQFHEEGIVKFADRAAGYISYLNREKDVRQFAYPVVHLVQVPPTTGELGNAVRKLEGIERQAKQIAADIQANDQSRDYIKQKVADKFVEDTEECLEEEIERERRRCLADAKANMHAMKTKNNKIYQEEKERLNEEKKRLSTEIKDLKKLIRKLEKTDRSVVTVLERTCGEKRTLGS